jgi:hypothetical protein
MKYKACSVLKAQTEYYVASFGIVCANKFINGKFIVEVKPSKNSPLFGELFFSACVNIYKSLG